LITYVDTSALVKLLVDDEVGTPTVEQLWVASTSVVCCEIGYVEARAALGAAVRARRITTGGLRAARETLDELWAQLDVVPVTTILIRRAADLAEAERLRGYDAIHLAAALVVPVDTLASSDSRLCEAAARQGLNVASPGRS
jgi:predicted nucleic acid-binding protein